MAWWTRESSRQLLATPFVLVSILVPGEVIVKVLAGWDLYAVVYLLLTWLAYRGRDPAALREMALTSRRFRPSDRFLVSPPDQLSQTAAGIALVATVIAMPQARQLGAPPPLVLGICVVAVLTAWLVLQAGFAIVYLGLYTDGGGLEFPGDDEPTIVDFVYFAVSVGTTFGTTDVTVTQRRVRRRVTAHGTLAFFFNTLILAVAATVLTSYISGG